MEQNGIGEVASTTSAKQKKAKKPVSPLEQARRDADKANGEWVKAAEQLDAAKAYCDQCEANARDKQAAYVKMVKR